MRKTFPPAPFPRKGVTQVQPRCAWLPDIERPSPWGGPEEAA